MALYGARRGGEGWWCGCRAGRVRCPCGAGAVPAVRVQRGAGAGAVPAVRGGTGGACGTGGAGSTGGAGGACGAVRAVQAVRAVRVVVVLGARWCGGVRARRVRTEGPRGSASVQTRYVLVTLAVVGDREVSDQLPVADFHAST
ncbi:hypothetical protein GCM10010493_27610 [Streptomyces lavendulae subsp. grasserius]